MKLLRRRSVRLAVATSALVLGATTPVTLVAASAPRAIVAGAGTLPAGAVVVTTPLTTTFDVVLRPQHPRELQAFIAALGDPTSPDYHQYLTPRAFAVRFGAAPAQVAAVRAYLRANGLQVRALDTSHLTLRVRGATSAIAHAFAAPVATVRVGDHLAAQFRANATLPAALARDVAGVAGLSQLTGATNHLVHARATTAAPTSCPAAGTDTGTSPNALGGYTVAQQAALYGLGAAWQAGHDASGSTIAIYELGAYDPSDLTTYFTCYGLNPTITTVNVDGGPGTAYNDEATMDVEETGALALGAAIEVYQGPNASTGPIDVYQKIADDDTANIVTTSWGTCESDPSGDPSAETPIFEQMATQGQTIIAAAGDDGSSDCHGITTNALAVDDPASQPLVTGVGGLSVTNLDPLTESVWNGNGGASGGGASAIWSRPSWQRGDGISARATMRLVPDLSVMGDPTTGFIQYYTGTNATLCGRHCAGGWGAIGGTSIGAPIVGALVATATNECGGARLGFLNPVLYATAASAVTDVTTGSNDLYQQGSYRAGVGYDEASGLGSPDGANFFSALCPAPLSASASSVSVSGAATVNGPGANVTVQLRDARGAPVVGASVLVALTGASASGSVTINADPSTSTASGATATLTSDASGAVHFSVQNSVAGPLALSVADGAASLAATTITFTTSRTPALAAPVALTVRANVTSAQVRVASTGADVTAFQFSLNGGASWTPAAFAAGVVTIAGLRSRHTYHVRLRALTTTGVSLASKPITVVTR